MGGTILLADDSLTIQKVVELTFAETGFTVVAVSSGDDLLQRLPQVRPDIVICDVIMPGRDGYDVCQQVKSSPATLHIPVILLTGTFEPFDRDRALAAGCSEIISKPFEALKLVETVERLSREVHAAPPPPAAVGLPVEGAVRPPTAERPPVPRPVPPPPPPSLGPLEDLAARVVTAPSPAPAPFADEAPFAPAATAEEVEPQGDEALDFTPAGFAEMEERGRQTQAQRAAHLPAEGLDFEPPPSLGEGVEPTEAMPAWAEAAAVHAPVEQADAVGTESLEPAVDEPWGPQPPQRESVWADQDLAEPEPEAEPPVESWLERPGEQPAAEPTAAATDEEPFAATPPDLAEPWQETAPEPPTAALHGGGDEPTAAADLPEPVAVAPPAVETPFVTTPLPRFVPTPAAPPEATAEEVSAPPPSAPWAEPEAEVWDEPTAAAPTVEVTPEPSRPPQPPVEKPAPPDEPVRVDTQPSVVVPAAAATGGLSDEDVDRIARRVLELSSPLIERIAWEVVPDMAEIVIRERVRRIEAEVERAAGEAIQ